MRSAYHGSYTGSLQPSEAKDKELAYSATAPWYKNLRVLFLGGHTWLGQEEGLLMEDSRAEAEVARGGEEEKEQHMGDCKELEKVPNKPF